MDLEYRTFKAQLNLDYFVMKLDDKALCLLCKDNMAVLTEYNVLQHYQTKHSSQYFQLAGKQRLGQFEKLKQNISS